MASTIIAIGRKGFLLRLFLLASQESSVVPYMHLQTGEWESWLAGLRIEVIVKVLMMLAR